MRAAIHTLFSGYLLVSAVASAEPALTIYNQDFAVVRDAVPLEIKPGVNQVRFTGTTAFLEPASVILRDPANKHEFRVLEQNYLADPVSQESLLALNEGKTIEFEITTQEGGQTRRELLPGKVVRSGSPQPIIEMAGKLRFGLPGQPIFPALADDTILKPTLLWLIEAERTAKFDAELSYVTGGMRWDADYNLVLPPQGNKLDLVGWVTMQNQSGKSFEHARIKLMAGDVSKIQDFGGFRRQRFGMGGGGGGAPPVTEKSFDEYHLYTLERPTTLLAQETKQVEFVRAAGVQSAALYVYDGVKLEPNQWVPEGAHFEAEYGAQGNKKVAAMREFTNSAANHLGLPLPKGKVRFYRRDTDGQMEFTGENIIDHTPRDEIIRVFTGYAFDLIGERKQTDFKVNLPGPSAGAIDVVTGLPVAAVPHTNTVSSPWIDESFEITVRNHKQEKVEIRIVEHLYRWTNWQLTKKPDPWRKTDAHTIELPVQLKPDEQRTLSYTVHYSW
jgi:hypothetical protein